MRKVFARVYELLDQGCAAEEISEQLKGSAKKSFEAALEHHRASTEFDRHGFGDGYGLIGVDEVGRGPLAGPLVAVCLSYSPPPPFLPFLRDSKKLGPQEREFLAVRVRQAASHVGIGTVEAAEFGQELNLHQLTFLAMTRAVEAAGLEKGRWGLLVDGKFKLPSWTGPQMAVIKGDDTSQHIAGASILAKVHRDRIMLEAARTYPEYDFENNVGYGTESHRKAILEHGPTPLHRTNFLQKILAE